MEHLSIDGSASLPRPGDDLLVLAARHELLLPLLVLPARRAPRCEPFRCAEIEEVEVASTQALIPKRSATARNHHETLRVHLPLVLDPAEQWNPVEQLE